MLHNGFRDLSANRVGLLTVTNFLLHTGAGDRSCFRARNPSSASDSTAGLFASGMAAAVLVFALVIQRVPTPRSWIGNDLLHDWTRNLFCFRNPITRADLNFFGFTDWLTDRVADIPVTGLGLGTVCRAANVTILGFANRLADRAADIPIACLEAGLANRAADVFVAGLVAGFANRATNVFVAGLETWLLDSAANVFVAGLIDWLANGVTLVAIACLVNVSRAGHGILFGTLFINSPAAIHDFLFIDSFANLFIAGSAATFRSAIVATRRTRL